MPSAVWKRANSRDEGTMTKNLYALSITFFTAVGVVFAALMSRISVNWTWVNEPHNRWPLAGFVLGVVVVAFLGTLIYNKSSRPGVSLLGYALVAGPFGLLLGPVVAQYTTASVLMILAITAAVVVVLGLVGACIPEKLEGWGSWLLGGLLVLIIGFFIVPLFGQGAMVLWNWLGIVLFSALVIYDFNRAMKLPRTLDNSIDAAAAIFMDSINLFIRFLIAGGQSNSSSSS